MRTGGVQPDLLCLSKGLTGGFLPLAAVLATQAIYDGFLDASRERAFLHSHSYTGNPLACAAALASLDIFASDDVLARNRGTAARMATLAAQAGAHQHVADVRQAGMIVAFRLARDGNRATPFDPPAHRPARLSRGAGAWRAAASARRRAVLDAAVLHRRCPAGIARGHHHRGDRRGHRMRLIAATSTSRSRPARAVALPESAAAHLTRVLRLREGDACVLFNGDGHDYDARLVSLGKRETLAEIGEARAVENESPLRIVLLQGIARGEKMDLILQKATELGVARIVPVDAERTEVRLDAARLEKRLAHWRSVVASACEQCGRARLPQVAAPVAISDVGARAAEAALRPDARSGRRALDDIAPGRRGRRPRSRRRPRGGWSPRDREALRVAGFAGLQLGPRILRTETAGLAAIAALQARFGDLGK